MKRITKAYEQYCAYMAKSGLGRTDLDFSFENFMAYLSRMNANEPPLPWTFEWDKTPIIYAADGTVVCVISTGSIDGAYPTERVIATANLIMSLSE